MPPGIAPGPAGAAGGARGCLRHLLCAGLPAYDAAVTEDPLLSAERRAGVKVRLVDDVAELGLVASLFADLWQEPGGQAPASAHLLAALRLSGNYVSSAWRDGELLGASMAWSGPPRGRELHSHVTGVRAARQGGGIGLALKLHQRSWAAERGYESITWTFDPLVRRNAAFNLLTLGARPERYLVNAYGEMDDVLNADGGESDRLLVRWHVAAEPVAAPLGAPPPGETRPVLVPTPEDVSELRRTAPSEAAAWRLRLREELASALAAGARITGLTKAGEYEVEVPVP